MRLGHVDAETLGLFLLMLFSTASVQAIDLFVFIGSRIGPLSVRQARFSHLLRVRCVTSPELVPAAAPSALCDGLQAVNTHHLLTSPGTSGERYRKAC